MSEPKTGKQRELFGNIQLPKAKETRKTGGRRSSEMSERIRRTTGASLANFKQKKEAE